jgi:hypothetical protein
MKHVAELSKQDSFVTGGGKQYRRSKIRTKDYQNLEILRADLAVERSRRKSAEILADIYFQCGRAYLGMTKEEIKDSDWEELKPALDACNFRTPYGLPN